MNWELQDNQRTINKMIITICLSIITLNVNGLNASIKRHSGLKTRYIPMLPIGDSL